jgi:tripartite-type tricarboxylate transporter receptor subunit TctC
MRPLKLAGVVAAAVLVLSASLAGAQSPAEFYRSKNVDLYIGTSVGGGYDAYARTLARHIGKYIPGNPAVVPKNMEGGGGIRLANFLYNAAAKDGSMIATFNRGTAFDPLLGNRAAQFEANKFNWIGSINNEISICALWHTTGVTTVEQLRTTEVLVGASGPSADTFQFPKIVNGVLGTKFKIIAGYPGGADIDVAIERGEVQGRCGWSWTAVKATRRHWLDEKKINIVFQMGLGKHADLPNTPLIMDLVKSDDERAIFKLIFGRQVMAWPYAAPPGVPKDRTDVLRAAFVATTKDKDFLADAARSRLDVAPVPGADIEKLLQEVYATPAAIAQRTTALLQ